MKKILAKLAASFAVLALGSSAAFAAAGWGDDYEKATTQAKAEKKLVLLDFTGSDWCSWCVKMDKEVFSTPEFKQYAQDNLVLVELDFPHNKPQNASTTEQNNTLKGQYGVQGFPTLVVLDSNGRKLKDFVGFQPGGPKAFIAQLDALKAGGVVSPIPAN